MKVGKLALLGVVIAAFAGPATASASPQLFEGSTALSPGASLELSSTNMLLTNSALGTVECGSVVLSAELTANSGSSVKAVGTAGESASCSASGLPATLTFLLLASIETNGGDQGAWAQTMVVDVSPFECHYKGSGAYSYTTNSSGMVVAGIVLVSEQEFCQPEEGNVILEGTFSLTTPNGTPVVIK